MPFPCPQTKTFSVKLLKYDTIFLSWLYRDDGYCHGIGFLQVNEKVINDWIQNLFIRHSGFHENLIQMTGKMNENNNRQNYNDNFNIETFADFSKTTSDFSKTTSDFSKTTGDLVKQ
ncbi:unnamed protein product [Owenia fusiformis]|uniref:Uncharacterized protein n=1 Tax=Owenia fusiformis TaxID=6347 RepID=A0A8J1UU05_OWEFU|nr:unnamed protein product [Owenia fusiformis]